MNEYCQRAIAAMSASAPGADVALQAQMPIVLKHLHAMIDELQPTDKELYEVMGWLNRVGRDGDFVMLCDVMGLTMRTVDLTHDRANATRANVEGPFAKDDVPVYENPVRFAANSEAGQRVEVRGKVTSATSGKPISAEEWEKRKHDWTPSPADEAYVKSLMSKPIYDPKQMANWIAAPPRGIKGMPVDYEYVRFNRD